MISVEHEDKDDRFELKLVLLLLGLLLAALQQGLFYDVMAQALAMVSLGLLLAVALMSLGRLGRALSGRLIQARSKEIPALPISSETPLPKKPEIDLNPECYASGAQAVILKLSLPGPRNTSALGGCLISPRPRNENKTWCHRSG